MTPEEQERLQELEDLLEDEHDGDMREMDEDERDELKDLRSMAREEKKRAKALAKFDKARTVFKVTTQIIGAGNTPTGENYVCYALDLATAHECTDRDSSSIEEIDRKSLTGRYSGAECFTDMACAVCGAYPDNGSWPSCPDCWRPVCSKCRVDVDDGHYGYWGCSACVAITIEFNAQVYGIQGKVVQL
jgi:hypothetical protein